MKRIHLLIFMMLIFGLSLGVFPHGCEGVKGVNILLVDNSRSVPHWDPTKDRVAVLREVLSFLNGYENRLILFGGRNEIILDNANYFTNDGWHTDYNYAFQAAVKIRKEYPPNCDVKVIFITDGLMDAFPEDYPEQHFRDKDESMAFARDQMFKLLDENRIPTYIILLGSSYNREFVNRISEHTNGLARTNPLVEKATDFLGNNGFLFKKFIYQLPAQGGVAEMKIIVGTIVHSDSPRIEIGLLLILIAVVLTLLIISLRPFPAPGDQEIILLPEGVQVLIGTTATSSATVFSPGRAHHRWGLKQVTNTDQATAGMIYQKRAFDFSSKGLKGLGKLDPISRRLLDEDIHTLANKLSEMESRGTDEEIIVATDLKYYCSNLEIEKVQAILKMRGMDRSLLEPADFLKAKVYVSMAPDLLEQMTEYKIFLTVPSGNVIRAEVLHGQKYPVGPYKMRVYSINKDSHFSATVTLEYVSMPSILAIKKIVPATLQKFLRLRRPIICRFNG